MAKVVTSDGIVLCRTARQSFEQLKSHIGTDCHNAVRAAGALVATLVKEQILLEKDGMVLIKDLQKLRVHKCGAIVVHRKLHRINVPGHMSRGTRDLMLFPCPVAGLSR